MRLFITISIATLCCACAGDVSQTPGASSNDPNDPSYRGTRAGGSLGGVGGGGEPQTVGRCEPSSAPNVFKNALCLCGDYRGAGNLRIQPAVDSKNKQSVFGVNGRFSQLGNGLVQGTLIAHQGIDGANLRVQGSMRSNRTVGVVNLDVGGDLFVGTDLTSFGVIVGGGVWVGGKVMTIFKAKPVSKLQGQLEPPCACGDKGLDVAGEVAAAKASNDNASAGLSQTANLLSAQKLVLNSGRYYFANARALGNAHILANGAVRIYVDGDMQFVGNERIEMTQGSTVDMYVAGNVASVGNVEVGDRYHPAAFRLYVGGNETVTIRHIGNKRFRGAIYAPRANIAVAGNVTFEGALFANTLSDAGNLILTFAQPSHSHGGRRCVAPPSTPAAPPLSPDDPGGPSGPGGKPPFDDPGGSGSDPDFNDRQPRGDAPPNKDGLPDPADLPRVM